MYTKNKKKDMKQIYVFLSVVLFCLGELTAQTVVTGTDGKSWTLATKSLSYQMKVSREGTLCMDHFGSNAFEAGSLKRSLGDEITVRGGYSSNTSMIDAIFEGRVRDIEQL